jgi:hypothetical protein
MLLELGEPTAKGGLDKERVVFTLRVGNEEFVSPGSSGWFEDEMLELQKLLPEGYIRSCIHCAFSDYSPHGHGLFGGLACFRDAKDAYRSVDGKQSLFELWDARTEYVQETHVCEQFERREPGAGYRG